MCPAEIPSTALHQFAIKIKNVADNLIGRPVLHPFSTSIKIGSVSGNPLSRIVFTKDHWWRMNTQKVNLKLALHPAVRASACCLRSKISQIASHTQGTRRTHVRNTTEHVRFLPAEHTQRPAEKNWHTHYFLRAPYDLKFAVSPEGTFTKNVRYPCVSQV